jgi:hypothetical protein
MSMIRTIGLLLLASFPLFGSGCFLFSGDDEKDKGAVTSQMEGGGSNNVDAVNSTPASPWRSIELHDEGGGSGSEILPIVSLVLSVVSLGLVSFHWFHHRHRSV